MLMKDIIQITASTSEGSSSPLSSLERPLNTQRQKFLDNEIKCWAPINSWTPNAEPRHCFAPFYSKFNFNAVWISSKVLKILLIFRLKERRKYGWFWFWPNLHPLIQIFISGLQATTLLVLFFGFFFKMLSKLLCYSDYFNWYKCN